LRDECWFKSILVVKNVYLNLNYNDVIKYNHTIIIYNSLGSSTSSWAFGIKLVLESLCILLFGIILVLRLIVTGRLVVVIGILVLGNEVCIYVDAYIYVISRLLRQGHLSIVLLLFIVIVVAFNIPSSSLFGFDIFLFSLLDIRGFRLFIITNHVLGCYSSLGGTVVILSLVLLV
jgi:hypothetical protein